MYEVSYNNKSLLKTYFLNLTHTSKTVLTQRQFSDFQTYLWAHFNLTVEAVCARNKGTKTIDQAHHITPKLSQPFLWSFSWKNDFVLRLTRAFWDIKRCAMKRRFVFPDDEALNHSATAKTLIKSSRQTWKTTNMKKYLINDRHWYSTHSSNDSFWKKYGKSWGKLRTIFCLVLFAVWFPVWRHIKTPPSRLSLWRRLSSRSPIYVCRNLYCLLIHLNTWYIIVLNSSYDLSDPLLNWDFHVVALMLWNTFCPKY